MKRAFLSLALTLVLILGITFALDLPVSAATSGTTGSCTWQISGTILTISGNGPMADYSDTNLPPWLESAPYITAIDVREGVTSVGSYAFIYCTEVNSVLLPSYSLTRIGDGAFLMCEDITSFWMPHTVTQLGMAVFGGCAKLQSLSISTDNPVYSSAGNCIVERATGKLVLGCRSSRMYENGGLRSIGEGAFMMVVADAFSDFTIPEGVTTIESGAFSYTNAIVRLPSTLTTIGEGAFLGAEISSLQFPEGLKHIPAYCCSESSISWINLPSTLESIGENAFSYCQRLNSVTLPQNLKTIGVDAFWASDLRETITIPNSVQFIGTSAFSANSALQGFKAEETHPYFKSVGNCLVEKSSGTLISGCKNSIIPASAGIRTIGDYAFAYTEIKNVQIPEGVTAIGEGAFCGCESLNYVRFDAPSVNVGHYAFAECHTLFELTLKKNPPTFQSTTFENTTVSAVWVEGATQQELNSSHLPAFASASWHYADNICDTACNVCTTTRSDDTTGHRYTNVCDPDCNRCSQERAVEGHTYYSDCDPSCNKCAETRPVPDHVYTGACDETCNVCNYSRGAKTHPYPYKCSTKCPDCGKTRTGYHITTVPLTPHTVENSTEYPFVLDGDGWYKSTNTAAGSAATFTLVGGHHCQNFAIIYEYGGSTGKGTLQIHHSNWNATIVNPEETGEQTKTFGFWITNRLTVTYTANGNIAKEDDCVRFKFVCSCSPTVRRNSEIVPASCAGAVICEYCNTTVKEALPHTYDNDCDTVCNACEGSRTVSHFYDSNCDAACNACSATRTAPAPHVYDNDCDTACNACGATRQTSHKYDDACDEACNVCSETRKAPHVYDDRSDLVCNRCQYRRPPYILGDVDGNDVVDLNDAIYLLYHLNFSNTYPVEQPVDFDGSGAENLDDALYLLYHVNFPDAYPLKEKAAWLWPLPAETPGTVTREYSNDHLGIDIEVGGWENNGKISALAVADGKVIRAGYYSDFGNLVVVDHGNGFSTYYAHLDSIAVSVGNVVSQGTVLGKIGATGNTTTVKLYLLMYAPAYEGGASVRTNPLYYLKHPA